MQITWYGHSAFRLDFAGRAVLIDPFFTGNPAFVSDKAAAIKDVTHIVLTHGHGDHVGDTLDIAKTNGATVTANFELGCGSMSKGLEKLNPMNTGGTTDLGGFTVAFVRADHSSGDITNGMPIYLGNPCGVIIKAKGEPTVYHLGDTDIFSDMALIAEISSAAGRLRADRRPLHHEPGDGGVGGEALPQTSKPWCRAITARSRSSRPNAGQVPGRDEGRSDQGDRAGKGQSQGMIPKSGNRFTEKIKQNSRSSHAIDLIHIHHRG